MKYTEEINTGMVNIRTSWSYHNVFSERLSLEMGAFKACKL